MHDADPMATGKKGSIMSFTGILRPGHIQIRVTDLERAVRHYADVIGLEEVLRGFGYKVQSASAAQPAPPAEADLNELARLAADCGELQFFSILRNELRQQLYRSSDGRLHLSGLRPCVKRLVGAVRWSPRCEGMSDRIVDYVRSCLSSEGHGQSCAVLIR